MSSVFNGLTAKNGTDFSSDKPPAGAHVGVLVALVDLGTHMKEYKNEKDGTTKQKPMREVYLAWELVNERMSGSDYNHVVGRRYALSFSDKAALRKMIEKVRGKPFAPGEAFDLPKMLGKPFQITVIHKQSGDKTYANFSDAGPLMKGTPVPAPKRKPFTWDVGSGQPLPDWLPYDYGESLADIVKRCHEVRGAPTPAAASAQPATVGANSEPERQPGEDPDETPF